MPRDVMSLFVAALISIPKTRSREGGASFVRRGIVIGIGMLRGVSTRRILLRPILDFVVSNEMD